MKIKAAMKVMLSVDEIIKLKNYCVHCRDYELAVRFRDEENKINEGNKKLKKIRKDKKISGEWILVENFLK